MITIFLYFLTCILYISVTRKKKQDHIKNFHIFAQIFWKKRNFRAITENYLKKRRAAHWITRKMYGMIKQKC